MVSSRSLGVVGTEFLSAQRGKYQLGDRGRESSDRLTDYWVEGPSKHIVL